MFVSKVWRHHSYDKEKNTVIIVVQETTCGHSNRSTTGLSAPTLLSPLRRSVGSDEGFHELFNRIHPRIEAFK